MKTESLTPSRQPLQTGQPREFDGTVPCRSLMIMSPVLVAMLAAGGIEWGWASMSSSPRPGDEIDASVVWLMQLLTTGAAAIFCFVVWLDSFFRARWPQDESLRMHAVLSTCWVSMGWVGYSLIRMELLEADDAFVPVLFVALVVLGIIVPLLWHAAHRLKHPAHAAVMLAVFLGSAVVLQLVSVTRIAAEPEFLFIANSVLIAVAIAIWLTVYSTTAGKPASFQYP